MSTLATFQKNALQEVGVSLEEFHGYDIFNIRVWNRAEDGEMRPGKQGLALRLEQLPDLMDALAIVEKAVGLESETA